MKSQRKNQKRRPDLRLLKTTPEQPTASFIIDCNPILMTTTVITGVYALAQLMDPTSQVQDWSSRFQTLFKDYRVVKASARFLLFASTTAGQLNAYFNESSSATPTPAAVEHEKVKRFPLSAVEKVHTLTWIPSGPQDLGFISTAIPTSSSAYLKVYTDSANYGAPIAVTTVGSIQMALTVQFREFV
jgi:hypothetical protein